ncbi:Exostosin-like [Thalictrum thalictroides]|uniref:Exostosin-like n=1 Tax=Thalictrum thalictroides TaxID=46969 RepID=A0A7J6V6N1_THATH|nr:Exostosin-like [Thalictrum thalictroides]
MISSMSEKSMKPSRYLLCLITLSMSLLILSSVFLLQSTTTSLLTGSVFKQIRINNSTLYFRPNSNSNSNANFNPRSVASTSNGKVQDLINRDSITSKEVRDFRQERRTVCDPNEDILKIFMYDLPPEFHFGLLGWNGTGDQIWPDVSNVSRVPPYPGGLNLQHSIEYWLTLDLLASNTLSVVRPCSVIRVETASQADVIFVPFFSSLSYNRHSKSQRREKKSINRMLQEKLVEFLTSREEWKRQDGKDHIILAHHPNSMLDVRKNLGSAMFVLADFGRYPTEVANIEKDIIAPYKHVVRTIKEDSADFDGRPILIYFQGAIYRKDGGFIRQELYYLLKDEKDVHFTFGSVRGNGINKAGQGMASSKFCLNIAGDTPSSNRLFDAITSHCVPVIISDEIELPFEDVLDYSEFCIFIRGSDAIKEGFVLKLLQGIKRDKWTKMWDKLKEVAHHFEYQYPSQPENAVDMIWGAISRRISSISSVQFRLHRENRFRLTEEIAKINGLNKKEFLSRNRLPSKREGGRGGRKRKQSKNNL